MMRNPSPTQSALPCICTGGAVGFALLNAELGGRPSLLAALQDAVASVLRDHRAEPHEACHALAHAAATWAAGTPGAGTNLLAAFEMAWLMLPTAPRVPGMGEIADVADREAPAPQAIGGAQVATKFIGVGTWEIDLATGHGHRSAEQANLLGTPERNFTPDSWARAFHPGDVADLRAAFGRAAESGEPFEVEFRSAAPAPDGGERWLLGRGRVQRDSEGRGTRALGMAIDVTGRKRAEAALTEAEAQRRDLLATLDLGAFMARDMDGTIRHWSKGCERLYGWTAEEALGRISHELLQTVFPVPLAEVEAILERQGEWVGELRHRTRDGRQLVLVARKVVRRAEPGCQAAVLEVLTDVTGQRQAEAALRHSEATLDAVLEALPIAIAIADGDGRLVRDNNAFRELWGTAPETGSWRDYQRWVGHWPRTAERVTAEAWPLARALLDGEVVRDELIECERFGSGEVRFGLNSAAPIRGAGGKIVGAVVGVLDVTFRHLAEVALAASEEHFRALAEAAPCVLFESDASGHVTYVNPYCETFSGLPGNLLKEDGWLQMLHPDDMARAGRAWSEAVRAEQPYNIEYRLRRHDRVYRWFVTRGLPRRNDAGKVVGWVGMSTEVTTPSRAQESSRRDQTLPDGDRSPRNQ